MFYNHTPHRFAELLYKRSKATKRLEVPPLVEEVSEGQRGILQYLTSTLSYIGEGGIQNTTSPSQSSDTPPKLGGEITTHQP
jgi:hypothetical protein